MSGEEIKNYTLYDIVIYSANILGVSTMLRPCGVLIYLEIDADAEISAIKTIKGNEIKVKNVPVYKNIKNLPDSATNILVTREVAEYLKNNPHLYAGHVYAADTSNDGAVYNGMGQMIGTRHLIQYK